MPAAFWGNAIIDWTITSLGHCAMDRSIVDLGGAALYGSPTGGN